MLQAGRAALRATDEETHMDDHTLIATGAVVLINVFTPKPGQLDAFIGPGDAQP